MLSSYLISLPSRQSVNNVRPWRVTGKAYRKISFTPPLLEPEEEHASLSLFAKVDSRSLKVFVFTRSRLFLPSSPIRLQLQETSSVCGRKYNKKSSRCMFL